MRRPMAQRGNVTNHPGISGAALLTRRPHHSRVHHHRWTGSDVVVEHGAGESISSAESRERCRSGQFRLQTTVTRTKSRWKLSESSVVLSRNHSNHLIKIKKIKIQKKIPNIQPSRPMHLRLPRHLLNGPANNINTLDPLAA